jgi:hypothetical protein
MKLVEPSDIARLVDLRAKAIGCLAVGAVPNAAWIEGVRDEALAILGLVDELAALMTPSAHEVN